jgi:hypothetical protein
MLFLSASGGLVLFTGTLDSKETFIAILGSPLRWAKREEGDEGSFVSVPLTFAARPPLQNL